MIIQADNVLNSGANFQVIKAAFVRRNVLPADFSLEDLSQPQSIQVFNTLGFLKGEALILEGENHLQSYEIRDMQGRLIQAASLDGNQAAISLDLKPGLYWLSIRDEKGNQRSLKLQR